MKQTSVDAVAKKALEQSTNPLGVDFELKPYTTYYGVRLDRKKMRPDKLIFLERFREPGYRFPKPVIHTTEKVLFK